MEKRPVDIRIFLDGKPYAARYWHHVPRAGDEIMLQYPPKGPKGEKCAFIVKRIVWGVEGPREADRDVQAVNIEVTRAKDSDDD